MSKHVVWKYGIPFVDKFSLELPKNSLILTVHQQSEGACLWVQCDPEAAKEERQFINVGTGHREVDDRYMNYIGTYFHESFVWHLYEDIRG